MKFPNVRLHKTRYFKLFLKGKNNFEKFGKVFKVHDFVLTTFKQVF